MRGRHGRAVGVGGRGRQAGRVVQRPRARGLARAVRARVRRGVPGLDRRRGGGRHHRPVGVGRLRGHGRVRHGPRRPALGRAGAGVAAREAGPLQLSRWKIALDPHMYHGELSVADELRNAADLGYSYLELSPRADWFFWQRYPKADDALIAETKKAAAETGVQISRWCRCSTGRRRTSRSARPRSATGGGCCRSPTTWSARWSTRSSPATRTGHCSPSTRSTGRWRSWSRTSSGTGSGSTSRRTRTTSPRPTTTPCRSSAGSTSRGSTTCSAPRTRSTSPTGRATCGG